MCVCEIEGQRLLEYCCTEDWEMQHVFPLIRSQLRERERGGGRNERGGCEGGVKISRYIKVSYVNINTRVTRRENENEAVSHKDQLHKSHMQRGSAVCVLCALYIFCIKEYEWPSMSHNATYLSIQCEPMIFNIFFLTLYLIDQNRKETCFTSIILHIFCLHIHIYIKNICKYFYRHNKKIWNVTKLYGKL